MFHNSIGKGSDERGGSHLEALGCLVAREAGGQTFKGERYSWELRLHPGGHREPLGICCRELK